MTSLRNSKQSRLNSRKNLRMLITPKRRSRWVNCPGLTVKEMLILLVWNAKLNYNSGCEIRLVFISFSQCLAEDLDSCGRTLSELDAAVQEFGRRNPLLAKQLGDAISKLSEMHHHTTRLADCRNNWLKKVDFFSALLYIVQLLCCFFFFAITFLSWLLRLSAIWMSIMRCWTSLWGGRRKPGACWGQTSSGTPPFICRSRYGCIRWVWGPEGYPQRFYCDIQIQTFALFSAIYMLIHAHFTGTSGFVPMHAFNSGTGCRESTRRPFYSAFHSLSCCPVFRLSFVSLESSMETWSQWQRKWSFCLRCCRSRLWASRFVNSVDTLRSFSKASRFGCRAWRMQIRYNLFGLYHSWIPFFLSLLYLTFRICLKEYEYL